MVLPDEDRLILPEYSHVDVGVQHDYKIGDKVVIIDGWEIERYIDSIWEIRSINSDNFILTNGWNYTYLQIIPLPKNVKTIPSLLNGYEYIDTGV